MDNELLEELEKLPKNDDKEESLDEYRFIANCLSVGLRIENLKEMEHKEVMKILLCFIDNSKNKKKQATQSDWDALAR